MTSSKQKTRIPDPYSEAHFVEHLTNGSYSFLHSSLSWIFWNAPPDFISYFGLPSINEVLLFILIFENRRGLSQEERDSLVKLCTDYIK
jgi:hypothetical protein